jgi:hypothetical protein
VRITIESDRPVTVTPEPGHSGAWTVFGIRDSGEPVPLAVVAGGEALAYRNDRFIGGVWEETVTADGPREAARQGADQARAKLAEASWPTRGAA